MNRNSSSTLGEAFLAQVRGVKSEIPPHLADFVPCIADFVKDVVSPHHGSRPAGSVAIDIACDVHNGRLMRLWMSHKAGRVTFGGEGHKGAWETDSSGRGAVLVRCTRQGCRNSARLTNEWLVAHLSTVRRDFEAGKGLPIAWLPLSQVGSTSS
jgi:hypothetical protein